MKYGLRVFDHSLYRELLEAQDIDETQLKDLVLICPECEQSLIYVKAQKRSRPKSGGWALVEAHLKHEKDTYKTKICIHRVAKYDQKYLQDYQNKQREQRIRFIRQKFWNLFVNYYDSVGFPVSAWMAEQEKDGSYVQNELFGVLCNYFVEKFKLEPTKEITRVTQTTLEGVFSGIPIIFGIDPSRPEMNVSPSPKLQKAFSEKLSKKLDRRLQTRIAVEVTEYLQSPKASPILHQLFLLAIYILLDAMNDLIESGADPGLMGFIGHNVGVVNKDHLLLGENQMALNLSFLKKPFNQALMYEYASKHVIFWISILPWNLEIEKDCKQQSSISNSNKKKITHQSK